VNNRPFLKKWYKLFLDMVYNSNMNDCTVNILGTEYSIKFREPSNDKMLEDADGYTDYTSKEIVMLSINRNEVGDFEALMKKQLRHEIIHAMLAESGLQSNYQHCEQFGHDETMVDWVAIQFPKLLKIYTELNIL
jgi:hypothetical protein